MLRELLSILRPGNPLNAMTENFAEMLRLTSSMTVTAGDVFFRKPVPPETRSQIYQMDVRVNKLERMIRKQVVTHLSTGHDLLELPYCLLLMSLVKDVERLGDYAKNLTEVVDIYPGELPDVAITGDLLEIRASVEEILLSAAKVIEDSDHERALNLIRQGKQTGRRTDGLLSRIAQSGYSSGETTALVLGARYYKRIGGHAINLLSSVVMPLHKVDYYDEDEIKVDG